MATYAIGDVQGCLAPLKKLLDKINFEPQDDTLWFAGDLINRGPNSLECLRFIKNLGSKHVCVLGNHDLHFLAVAGGHTSERPDDTLKEILLAPDKHELVSWLSSRPLLHHENNYVLVHAGIAPVWTLEKAKQLAQEFCEVLQSESSSLLIANVYGNKPNQWDDALQGVERWRCIMSFFTRMRLCYADGSLEFNFKGELANRPQELFPWFNVPDREIISAKILFGHWSALGGKTGSKTIFALDTGCVWGNCLTALRLEDETRFSVSC